MQTVTIRLINPSFINFIPLFYSKFALFCPSHAPLPNKIYYYSPLKIIKLFASTTMHKSRPRSASASSCTHGKPLMQTKYKQRTGSRSVLDQSACLNESIILPEPAHKEKSNNPKGASARKRSNSVIIEPSRAGSEDLDKEQFRKSSVKIMDQNFKHHHPELCVCEQCLCGRHLCNLHAVSPNLTKTTTYAKDYTKKSVTPSKVVIATQYGKLQGPHLQLNSSYLKSYPEKVNDDLSRPKPEDLLKTGGPCPNLTSYTAEFPGHRGLNQYVKPTDKHIREKFPLRGRTTYNNFFLGTPGKKDDWQGIQNNLKTGSGWFGETSYNNYFKAPNPENYASIVKKREKLQINPDYKRQYETSYGNDFVKHPKAVCPAKITLETKRSGEFRDSKIKFKENADYKAMSPQFRSYSANRCH